MIDALKRMNGHIAWADNRILEALRHAGDASPRALEIFAHVLGSEHVWLTRMLGTSARVAVWPAYDVDQCAELAAANHEAAAAFLDSLDDESVERSVHYRNSAGAAFDSKLSDILMHMALHGAYHRGQVNLLLRGAGAEPMPTDYIALSRGAPAATRTP